VLSLSLPQELDSLSFKALLTLHQVLSVSSLFTQ
jgi:hypothetical protein